MCWNSLPPCIFTFLGEVSVCCCCICMAGETAGQTPKQVVRVNWEHLIEKPIKPSSHIWKSLLYILRQVRDTESERIMFNSSIVEVAVNVVVADCAEPAKPTANPDWRCCRAVEGAFLEAFRPDYFVLLATGKV